MNLTTLFRVFAWAGAVGFLCDALRRCWVVEAWSILPIVAVALALSLRRLRVEWRCARHRARPAAFLRIR